MKGKHFLLFAGIFFLIKIFWKYQKSDSVLVRLWPGYTVFSNIGNKIGRYYEVA
jgi:hypothetical protein